MAAFVFNQANGTLLSAISPLWAGDVSTLQVQSSQLQGTGIFSFNTAYLNESGSSFAVVKYSPTYTPAAVAYTFIRSTGVNTSGYTASIQTTSVQFRRNNVFVTSYTFSSGHDASTTATEIKLEQVGSDVKVYGGPIGSAVLIGTYTDATPLTGGFSGFSILGNGAATITGAISFDNGVSSYTYARPASDITTQWTPSSGTQHYALINETTYNDANYIYATAAAQTDEVGLQTMTTPQAGTNLYINYRVQGITGGGSVTVSLYCGATLVKTDTTRTADNTTPAYYTMTVTSAEWASVTNWADMRLRFVSA